MAQVQPLQSPADNASGHRAFTELPLVDIRDLRADDPAARQAVAEQLGRAAREVGFLYVTGHGVDAAVIASLLDTTRAYFDQPLTEKMRHYIGQSVNHSGYVPEGEEQFGSDSAYAVVDHKETYDVNFDYRPDVGRRPMLGPTQWPDSPGFKRDIKAYYDQVFALSQDLFRGFALALGLDENRLVECAKNPPSQLRLIHYPHNPDAQDDRPGIGAHTDYECFTVLLPTAPGLEVLNGAGDWIDVPLVEGAFVINIGDMLEVLSNGRFLATSHRVRKVAEERYSFPFFCACDYDTVIEPLSEFSDDGDSRYQPVVCGDHLYAQTAQTFRYLKERLARGDITLPEKALGLSSFGPEAR
ncbi:isopenicillin N synthase family dioxygenase [Marinimicrobium alkaliphilum]|uniref:isopenicillin N synthase family dioxygenase n=1 Tax=Marinimicrobium alkaliphilum TaxID=2202654 RepID=UPI0018E0B4BA|nr:isopenicillin N synthase family oxygenase [Marinimicrobium alkaliphilum]